MACNYTSWDLLLQCANESTSGYFGGITPFIIFIIVYGFTSIYGFKKSFVTASFISFVVSLPLFTLGLVPGWEMVIFMVFTLIGVFYSK
jgi:hypothetical protein